MDPQKYVITKFYCICAMVSCWQSLLHCGSIFLHLFEAFLFLLSWNRHLSQLSGSVFCQQQLLPAAAVVVAVLVAVCVHMKVQ